MRTIIATDVWLTRLLAATGTNTQTHGNLTECTTGAGGCHRVYATETTIVNFVVAAALAVAFVRIAVVIGATSIGANVSAIEKAATKQGYRATLALIMLAQKGTACFSLPCAATVCAVSLCPSSVVDVSRPHSPYLLQSLPLFAGTELTRLLSLAPRGVLPLARYSHLAGDGAVCTTVTFGGAC